MEDTKIFCLYSLYILDDAAANTEADTTGTTDHQASGDSAEIKNSVDGVIDDEKPY